MTVTLTELIARLRSGEITFDQFVATAAANYRRRSVPAYPDTDSDPGYTFGISAATVSNARMQGLLTVDEANAIYDAVG
jgi:hypothetical protein